MRTARPLRRRYRGEPEGMPRGESFRGGSGESPTARSPHTARPDRKTNPSAAASQVGNLFVGAALVEALGILAFVLGILAWLG